MKKIHVIISLFVLLLTSCSLFNQDTQAVAKPRYHRGWYKDHTYHRKIGVGRVRIKWFEKQGTKTVQMK